jgi:DnaD/phage-associated family protein
MSTHFNGFQENIKEFTGIPDEFFRELLPELEDINEIKLCLYILWKAYTIGDFGMPITAADILLDKIFIGGLESSTEKTEKLVAEILEKAVVDNILLKNKSGSIGKPDIYFINSPLGRKAASEKSYEFQPANITLDHIQPNIFRLYQENIGPLTPIIADALREAEDIYPVEWIKEAIQIAVQNNVRRWRYVEKILDRWQKEGRDGTDRENNQEDYRRYIKGEYGEIGHH